VTSTPDDGGALDPSSGGAVVRVREHDVEEQHRAQVRAVGREAADVDVTILELPPARVRRARIVEASGQHRASPRCGGRAARHHRGTGDRVRGVPVHVAAVVIDHVEPRLAGRERRAVREVARGPAIRGRRRNVRPQHVAREQAGAEHGATVDVVAQVLVRRGQRAEAERVEAVRRDAREMRERCASQSHAPADRPPLAGLGLDQRFGRNDGGIERRPARVVAQSLVRDAHRDRDRARGVLALVLAQLPLPRQEPDRVGDARAQSRVQVGAGSERFEPELERHRHGQDPLSRKLTGCVTDSTGLGVATRRPMSLSGRAARARTSWRVSITMSKSSSPVVRWLVSGGTASRIACGARDFGALKPNAALVACSALGIESVHASSAQIATLGPLVVVPGP
jgi:hypothetical protein